MALYQQHPNTCRLVKLRPLLPSSDEVCLTRPILANLLLRRVSSTGCRSSSNAWKYSCASANKSSNCSVPKQFVAIKLEPSISVVSFHLAHWLRKSCLLLVDIDVDLTYSSCRTTTTATPKSSIDPQMMYCRQEVICRKTVSWDSFLVEYAYSGSRGRHSDFQASYVLADGDRAVRDIFSSNIPG